MDGCEIRSHHFEAMGNPTRFAPLWNNEKPLVVGIHGEIHLFATKKHTKRTPNPHSLLDKLPPLQPKRTPKVGSPILAPRPEMSEAQLQAALQGLQEATARFGAEAPEAAEAKAGGAGGGAGGGVGRFGGWGFWGSKWDPP